MTLRLNQVHFTPSTKTAATDASVGKDAARQQLVEMAVSLVSSGSPKSGFLRLSLQKGETHLAHGRMGSGYTAAGALVKDLLHKAYGADAEAVQKFERYLEGRGKVGVKSFLQLLGHLDPQQLGAKPELGRLNLDGMGGRLRLILKQDGKQAPGQATAPPPVAQAPSSQAQPIAAQAPPWSPSGRLMLSKQNLQTPGVLCPPSRLQAGPHALHTQAFAAFHKAGVSFGVPGQAKGENHKQGKITIEGKAYDYSARPVVAKGSGAAIWMIGLKDPAGANTEFVIKANPAKLAAPEDDPVMAQFFAMGREKDLGEVQVLDLMSGNEHALQFHGAYSMPDGTLVYAMEKAAGDMLAVAEERVEDALANRLVTSAQDAHILQAAQALADLHACGQVHGDVKSDNFMLGVNGKVRIADFGESHKISDQQRRVGLQDDVRRFAAMACRIRYGAEFHPDRVAQTLQARQEELELDFSLQLSAATAAHEALIRDLKGQPDADPQILAGLTERLSRLKNPATEIEALLEGSGSAESERVRDYAFNKLMLEAVKTAAPDFSYMAGLSQRLARLVPGAQMPAATRPIQAQGSAAQPDPPAQAPRRDVKGMRQLSVSKGVRQLTDGKQISWYKPSNRPLNNAAKCIAMGMLSPSQAPGATEATARLPEREVAASIIAKLLIPHMAVGAELASDAGSNGVLLQHAKGNTATESMDWEAQPIAMRPSVYTKIASQLSDLQAFDYLIGNVDRHLENYVIDGTSVRAIDNDLSFPTVPVGQLAAVPDSKFGGLPKGYSPQLRQGLARIDTAQLERDIRPLIGNQAFAQLLDRLDKLKADASGPAKAATAAQPSSRFLTGL